MISVIHHITRTTYNEENPFGLKETFGVASTNIDLIREQIAVQAAEYLKNGLGEGFKVRDGEILQYDHKESLNVTKTSIGIDCVFTGNEITFWLAEEEETNFEQGVIFEISSQPYSEDGFVYPDIPTLEGDDDIVITELKYNIFSHRLRVTYHSRKCEEALKNSKFIISHNNRYVEENGRTFHGHTDINGDFNFDNEKNGCLEECITKGWERNVFLDAKKQLVSCGLSDISEYSIDYVYDGTSDYLAMGGDEIEEGIHDYLELSDQLGAQSSEPEEETLTVNISVTEQRFLCDIICEAIDTAKADQLEEIQQMDENDAAIMQTHIDFLKDLLEKFKVQ